MVEWTGENKYKSTISDNLKSKYVDAQNSYLWQWGYNNLHGTINLMLDSYNLSSQKT